jgi:hypothetical protein
MAVGNSRLDNQMKKNTVPYFSMTTEDSTDKTWKKN